jgi:hypothetical protein
MLHQLALLGSSIRHLPHAAASQVCQGTSCMLTNKGREGDHSSCRAIARRQLNEVIHNAQELSVACFREVQ